jgi:phosphoserine phosphatase
MSSKPRFATVVLDVDSTVADIEGIDWLAELRAPEIAAEIANLTHQAMIGAIRLESVYAERLALVAPTRDDVASLGRAYVSALMPGSIEVIADLQAAGVRVILVSGGLREALLPAADALGIPHEDVHGVGIRFDANGDFEEFDRASQLATSAGKPLVVERLGLPRPILAMGDGATDAALAPVVDTFAAFTGIVRRPAVVEAAAVEIRSFSDLKNYVLTGQ